MTRIPKATAAVLVALLLISMMIYAPKGVRAECGVYHTVQAGQNLYRISLRYGVSIASIAAANEIANVNLIYVGQSLYIPCADSNSGGNTTTTTTSDPSIDPSSGQFVTDPNALDCTGFVGTSPDAFTLGSSIFYWDPPKYVEPARYQVRIFNEQGANVGSFEVLSPYTTLTGDTSITSIGEGINFYWYVLAVTADNRMCRTPTRYAQREWPKGAPPVVPTAAPTVVAQ
jgi:murein DD-endopeptidase MepM/ murein hydrolase activator NlpD